MSSDFEPLNVNWTSKTGEHDGGVSTGVGFTISWQRGGRNEASRNGAFLIEVLEACNNQLSYYQESRYFCHENAEALHYLGKCLQVLKDRRDRRKREGTLGSQKVDKIEIKKITEENQK